MSASGVEGLGFDPRLNHTTECTNWHSNGYLARHLALRGQCKDWLAQCQYTVMRWISKFDLQVLRQDLSRSIPDHPGERGVFSTVDQWAICMKCTPLWLDALTLVRDSRPWYLLVSWVTWVDSLTSELVCIRFWASSVNWSITGCWDRICSRCFWNNSNTHCDSLSKHSMISSHIIGQTH